MDLYGENRIDIENKATNAEYMEYILAEPYVKDELISDINKDLKNNLYGAMLGLKNKNADCRVLLNDRRTRNMKNENIY